MSIWKTVKVVNTSARLKDNLVLLCLRLLHHYIKMFPFNLPGIVCMHPWGVFQNHILQGGRG